MGIWLIQTWTVAKGKIEAHDNLYRRWFEFGKGKTDKKGKFFNTELGPIGGRVMVIQFDSYAGYEQFFELWNQDEEWLKLQQEWFTLIDPNTYQSFFWEETELSLNW